MSPEQPQKCQQKETIKCWYFQVSDREFFEKVHYQQFTQPISRTQLLNFFYGLQWKYIRIIKIQSIFENTVCCLIDPHLLIGLFISLIRCHAVICQNTAQIIILHIGIPFRIRSIDLMIEYFCPHHQKSSQPKYSDQCNQFFPGHKKIKSNSCHQHTTDRCFFKSVQRSCHSQYNPPNHSSDRSFLFFHLIKQQQCSSCHHNPSCFGILHPDITFISKINQQNAIHQPGLCPLQLLEPDPCYSCQCSKNRRKLYDGIPWYPPMPNSVKQAIQQPQQIILANNMRIMHTPCAIYNHRNTDIIICFKCRSKQKHHSCQHCQIKKTGKPDCSGFPVQPLCNFFHLRLSVSSCIFLAYLSYLFYGRITIHYFSFLWIFFYSFLLHTESGQH